MTQRILKDFIRKQPKTYYLHMANNGTSFILINKYDNRVNKMAIDSMHVIQYRDITFGAPTRHLLIFERQLMDLGYKPDSDLLLKQLTKEDRTDVLGNSDDLIDWLMGDDDIMF